MKIYRNGTEVADVKPLDTSYVKEAIMGENSLTLEFYSQSAIDLRRGDSCSVFERTYVASKIPIPEITQGVYKYTITMHSMREETRKALLMQYGSPEVVYTCTPAEFLALVVASLQRVQPSVGWTAGDAVVGELLTLSFTNQTCYEALDAVCAKDKWDTEWYVQGHTIHLKEQTQAPVGVSTLSVGAGLRTITPDNSDREYYTRLYALGSTRNSVDGSRLQMTTPYIDVPGATQIIERVQVFDEIYPRLANATVTNVEYGSITRWADLNLTFNPEEQQIDGLALHVVFLSGLLVGLDFEANFRVDTFTLIPYTDEGGVTWPNAAAYPQVGDKYVLYNLSMPEAYVTAAKAELLAKAQALVAEMSQEPIAVNVTTDDGFFLSTGNRLRLGDVMTIESDTIPVLMGDRSIRLVEFKRYLNTDYRYDSIKFSDTVYKNPLTQVQNDVKETRQVINRARLDNPSYAARNWRDTQETLNMLNQAVGNFTNGITPVSVQAMTLLLGDDSLQFRFVDNTTSPQEVEHAFTYNPSIKILSTAAGIIQHMTLGIETLSSSRAVSAYRFWNVASFSSFTMDSPDQAWWLYLVCSKSTTSAGFTLISSHLAFETTDSYNLLVGILNSEYDGDRSFTPLFGYTEITPGRMRLKKVISPDGNTFIDLVTGTIQGALRFTSGTDVETALGYAQSTASSAASTANEAKNFIDNTLPGELSYLQNQIDGVIDSWFFPYTPTTANQPANTWTTAALKAQHVGDTFTNTQPYVDDTTTPDAGKSWRWVYDEAFDQYIWTPIADSDAVKALLAASEAQDTADSKRRIFTGTAPYPPYEVGDLWSGGPSGDLKRCKTARLTGTYNAADWELASKYTDDTAANAAQADATAALGKIDNIVSDNILSAAEKPSQRLAWDTIAAEKSVIETQATNVGITTEKTSYTYAFQALATYLNAGTTWESGIPSWLADANLATDTTIVGATYRSKWKEYYDARTALLNAISAKAKALADGAGSVAAAAQQSAEAAQTDATNALSAISNITSDNVLSAAEKPAQRQAWDVIAAEKAGLETQADNFGITTEKTAYTNAFMALGNYMNDGEGFAVGMIPGFIADTALATDEVIDGATYRSTWKAYYNAKTALLNAVSSKAKTLADSKRRHFMGTYPYPPYDVGDLWTNGSVLKRCSTTRLTGQYNAADWEPAVGYDNTQTTIDGGIVTGGTIQVAGDANSILAGITGQGTAAESVRLWAGNTFANRAAAPFRVQQNGEAYMSAAEILSGCKIGLFDIIGGNVIGRDSTGAEKIRIAIEDIPSASALSSNWVLFPSVDFSQSMNGSVSNLWGDGSVWSPMSGFIEQYATVPYATNIKMNIGSWGFDLGNDSGQVTKKIATFYLNIWNSNMESIYAGYYNTNGQEISLPAAGDYKFRWTIYLTLNINAGYETEFTFWYVGSQQLYYQEAVQKTAVGKNGLYSFFSSSEFFHFMVGEGFGAKVPDGTKWNTPGVLASATVASNGSSSNKFGAKTGDTSRTGTGAYTINHSIGHTNYTIIANANQYDRHVIYLTKGSTSVTVQVKNGSGTLLDQQFDYVIIGNN